MSNCRSPIIIMAPEVCGGLIHLFPSLETGRNFDGIIFPWEDSSSSTNVFYTRVGLFASDLLRLRDKFIFGNLKKKTPVLVVKPILVVTCALESKVISTNFTVIFLSNYAQKQQKGWAASESARWQKAITKFWEMEKFKLRKSLVLMFFKEMKLA